jgi:hypothetical protein
MIHPHPGRPAYGHGYDTSSSASCVSAGGGVAL